MAPLTNNFDIESDIGNKIQNIYLYNIVNWYCYSEVPLCISIDVDVTSVDHSNKLFN